MQKMGEQYPNCYCWDVLNEIVPELETGRPTEEERKDGLRHSLWYEYLGEEFYIDVLETARESLSEGTKLFYNEFGEQHPEKRKAILNVIANIKKYEEKTGKVILDGIGLQSHYDLNVTEEQIEQIYSDFSKIGKEVQVTEIDIMPGKDKKRRVKAFDEKKFEKLWRKVFECTERYEIQAFTGWGISDALNWFSHIDAIPTMVDKDGNIKGFAKEFIEKQVLKENQTQKQENGFITNLSDLVVSDDIEYAQNTENITQSSTIETQSKEINKKEEI